MSLPMQRSSSLRTFFPQHGIDELLALKAGSRPETQPLSLLGTLPFSVVASLRKQRDVHHILTKLFDDISVGPALARRKRSAKALVLESTTAGDNETSEDILEEIMGCLSESDTPKNIYELDKNGKYIWDQRSFVQLPKAGDIVVTNGAKRGCRWEMGEIVKQNE